MPDSSGLGALARVSGAEPTTSVDDAVAVRSAVGFGCAATSAGAPCPRWSRPGLWDTWNCSSVHCRRVLGQRPAAQPLQGAHSELSLQGYGDFALCPPPGQRPSVAAGAGQSSARGQTSATASGTRGGASWGCATSPFRSWPVPASASRRRCALQQGGCGNVTTFYCHTAEEANRTETRITTRARSLRLDEPARRLDCPLLSLVPSLPLPDRSGTSARFV